MNTTNTWAKAFFRYYLTVVRWPRTELRQIDSAARRVIAANSGHHRCAAIECLYLKRDNGGIGIMIIEQQWVREQISMVSYLQQSNNLWLQVFLRHQIKQSLTSSTNPVAAGHITLRKVWHWHAKNRTVVQQCVKSVNRGPNDGIRISTQE